MKRILLAGLIGLAGMAIAEEPAKVAPAPTAVEMLQIQEKAIADAKDDMQTKSLAAQTSTIRYLQQAEQYRLAEAAARAECKGTLAVNNGAWKCTPVATVSQKTAVTGHNPAPTSAAPVVKQ